MIIPFSEAQQHAFMEVAIEAGRKSKSIRGLGGPYVGAVIVSPEGEIVAEGHKTFLPGTSLLQHAERNAITNLRGSPKDHYLIATLEPCFTKRKRGLLFSSCSDLIVEKGLAGVIFGLPESPMKRDPQLGVQHLRCNNIEVAQYQGLNDSIATELMGRHYRSFLK
jgi:pyrimidine deaminase RibD-like protein